MVGLDDALEAFHLSVAPKQEARHSGADAQPRGGGSRFLLASEPTEPQARGFELQGMDQDRDAGMSATA
ncbi:MAG: hypothetical protein OXH79_05780 [Boseongicola sp.]|nr:hypothetical protein [Boseongicola sp.]